MHAMPAAAPSPAERRRRRAAIARCLLGPSALPVDPDRLDAIDWAALDRAPDWLGWPDAARAVLQVRVGALLHASAIRLWIDRARLTALREIVGQPFLNALLAMPAAGSLPAARAQPCPIDQSAQVGPLLRADGASLLRATLPAGPLRLAVDARLAPASPVSVAAVLAEALVARALALAPIDTDDPQDPAGAADAGLNPHPRATQPLRLPEPLLESVS